MQLALHFLCIGHVNPSKEGKEEEEKEEKKAAAPAAPRTPAEVGWHILKSAVSRTQSSVDTNVLMLPLLAAVPLPVLTGAGGRNAGAAQNDIGKLKKEAAVVHNLNNFACTLFFAFAAFLPFLFLSFGV